MKHSAFARLFTSVLALVLSLGALVLIQQVHAAETISLQYDDHMDISGKTVEIVDASTPTLTIEGNYLVATGIGSAQIRMDGILYEVAVEKAPINIVVIMGQSNAGNHFKNATSDVTCPIGTAYWWGNGKGTAATEPVDYTQPSMGFHTPLLAELYAQSMAAGKPVKNVMIWHEGITSKNGQSITKWASSTTDTSGTDATVTMIENCLNYYNQHSDKYEVVGKGVYWLQGESDVKMDPEAYTSRFMAMWEQLKSAGMEYLAFLRVRGPSGSNTSSNDDTFHNAASSAQFEMVRRNADMFMATTLTEAWTGPATSSHSVDVSHYITFKETYGQSPVYSDSHGNKATYADGILTTTMKELYGSNNKVHYGKFGYGLIGADAAYNMYAALHGSRNVTFVQTDTSGKKEAEHIASAGTVQVLDIEALTNDLSFYPGCGSPAGTMQIAVSSLGKDITDQVISQEKDHYGAVSVEALRNYLNPVITVSYTHNGVTDQVKYELRFTHPCQTAHTYTTEVTPPTCTQQGYTTHTCTVCGHSYVDSYVEPISHSYENNTCIYCKHMRIQVTSNDIGQTVGGVYIADGTYNPAYTNNWFADIPIPKGAKQVRFLTFKTGAGCGSVFFGGGKYISGYGDTEKGGQWVTLDIPAGADIFRYCYVNDSVAQNAGLPLFDCLEFYGSELGPIEQPPFAYRPSTGCHSFTVEVNIAPAQGNPNGYLPGTDYGYIQLPTNYSPYGEPTRLIIACHGAGASIDTYRSSAWKNTNYSFWTDLGYAVMDMYACPPELTGNNDCLHYGNPVVLECYKKGYEYVLEKFNLKRDGIFLVGSSMGGLSSFQIAQSGQFPVIAQVGYCPAIDLFKQAYCNPWTTASYQRSRIASYFGFAGTAPSFTNGKYPSAVEIEYYRQNFEKTIAYSPILRNVIAGDAAAIFGVIPNSATASDAAEAAIYAQLTAMHPNPLMIFHNTDDATVSYRYSQYFVDMVNRSGQNAILRTFTSGGHNAWANGASVTVQGINGSITLKESQYEAYLFFEKFEQHTEHFAWVDPAVAATCTESGLTEGKHCASCGEVLTKQETIPAHGHKWNAATCEIAKTCSVCGKTEGAANGHQWNVATCEKAKTCSVCGKTEGSANGHKWNAATCETAKTCSVCGKTEGAANGHKWNAASCETPKTCSACGKTEGAANGHQWNAATCEKAKTCSVCGKTEGTANGHKWNAATCEKAKTCSVCGKTEGAANGHKWNAATCEKAKTCSVCGKTEGAVAGHKWAAATCSKAKTCTVCGKTEGKPNDHSWDKGTVTKPATEETEGVMTYKCTACGETKTATIPVLSHTHKYEKAVTQPTCTEQGYTTYTCKCGHSYVDNYVSATGHKAVTDAAVDATCTKTGLTAGAHCSVCGEVIKKQETVPAKGHSWDNGTVTKPATETAEGVMTYKCTACVESKTAAIPVLSHTHKYEKTVTQPTCAEQGYTTYTCKCGHSYVDNYVSATGHKSVTDSAVAPTCTKMGLTAGAHCSVCGEVIKKQETVPAKGHSWDNGTVTKPATETAEGVMTYKCTACGETKTATIPVLLHTHKYEKTVTQPTCTEQGYTTYTCECGDSYVDKYTDAEGHDWDKGAVTKPATEEEEGIITFTCTVCGGTKTSTFPKLSHSHKYIEKTLQPTCTTEGIQVLICSCGDQKTEVLPMLNHRYKDGKCQFCGKPKVEMLLGDVDGDGTLSYNDALRVLRYSISLGELDDPTIADIDGDGAVTYNDALVILRKSIGL